MKMYKIGDKIQLKSWDELLELHKNGKLLSIIDISENFMFGIKKQNYIELSKKSLTIHSLTNDIFSIIESSYAIPLCFIKNQLVNLPEELFKF